MKKLKNSKKFILSVVIAAIVFSLAVPVLATTVAKQINVTYRDIRISVDGEIITPKDASGNIVEPFMYNGTTYLPVRAVSNAVGYDVAWDDSTSTVKLTKKQGTLKAELDNYSPKKNETTNLTVSGEGFEGLPYKATVYYKTTQTEYEGKVGEPCVIKVSSATAGWNVIVYVVVTDEANNKKYELVTSFTPAS